MLKTHNSTIAVIDSGIGGISILKQLIKKFGTGNYIYFADNKYMPYGTKDKEFVKSRVNEIINYLKTEYKADKIIIACNTASTCIYGGSLDDSVEILTFNKNDTYLTTKLTQSNLLSYKTISANHLAKDIEKNIFNKVKINKIVHKIVKTNKINKMESVVLGCTHYELVADIFKKYCPNTEIKLNSENLINKIENFGSIELKVTIILSKLNQKYSDKVINLLNSN